MQQKLEKIENDYKKNNWEMNLTRKLFISGILIASIIYNLYKIFAFSKIVLTILSFICPLIIAIIFLIIDFLHVTKSSIKRNEKEKIIFYTNYLIDRDDSDFNEVLYQNNITNKNDLEVLINYYSNKSPGTIDNTLTGWIIKIIIPTASFIILFISDKGIIDTNKLYIIFLELSNYMFIIIPLLFSTFTFFKGVKPSKNSIYLDLEKKLINKLLNFDNYKDYCNMIRLLD